MALHKQLRFRSTTIHYPPSSFSVPKLAMFTYLQVHAVDAQMGGMRRTIECISITDDDKYAYCGTRTGDVLKFKIDRDDIRVSVHPMCVFRALTILEMVAMMHLSLFYFGEIVRTGGYDTLVFLFFGEVVWASVVCRRYIYIYLSRLEPHQSSTPD